MRGEHGHQQPRAIIHKRIMDAAAARPNAALAELAGDVPGASTDLVERVLDEYGDPADSDPKETKSGSIPNSQHEPEAVPPTSHADPTPPKGAKPDRPAEEKTQTETEETQEESADINDPKEDTPATDNWRQEDANTDDNPQIDLETLSEKRRETLRAIHAYPEASQRELGAKLGVAGATISQRVSAIDGFNWENRAAFVAGLFDESRTEFDAAFGLDDSAEDAERIDTSSTTAGADKPASANTPGTRYEAVSDGGRSEHDSSLRSLQDRVESLEAALEAQNGTSSGDDPELLSKAIHACINADTISTEEEHRIIERLVT